MHTLELVKARHTLMIGTLKLIQLYAITSIDELFTLLAYLLIDLLFIYARLATKAIQLISIR
jgi:hypothetical protein